MSACTDDELAHNFSRHLENREMVRLHQCSISLALMVEKVIPLKHMRLRVDKQIAKYIAL